MYLKQWVGNLCRKFGKGIWGGNLYVLCITMHVAMHYASLCICLTLMHHERIINKTTFKLSIN